MPEDDTANSEALDELIDLERRAAELRSRLGLAHRVPIQVEGMATESAAYKLVARHASDMISVHAADGSFVWVSASCKHLFGWSRGDLVGRSCYEFVHDDDRDRVVESHRLHAHASETPGIEWRFATADGGHRWVCTHSSNTKDENQLPRIVSITRDITLQRERLDLLARARESRGEAPEPDGLLSVCAWCKAVRSETDAWSPIEEYLEAKDGRETTHGICPDCLSHVRGPMQNGRDE